MLRAIGSYLATAIVCLGGSIETLVNLKLVSSLEGGTHNYHIVTNAVSHTCSGMTVGEVTIT